MAHNNPLKQYFRQPKIFFKLPTGGLYSKAGVVQGNADKLPVFGMTGMDEIIMKTPDALLSGESIARVVASCCPSIADAWELANIDIDSLLVAIRIATYGNKMPITHKCSQCDAENSYDIDLGKFSEHYNNCKFDSKIVLDDIVIKIRPMMFKEANEFNLRNFALQKKLFQIDQLTSDEEKAPHLKAIFDELGEIQKQIILRSIDQIELPDSVVTERVYIEEYIENCDNIVFQKIREQFDLNVKSWKVPESVVKCNDCGADESIPVELNQTNFFAGA